MRKGLVRIILGIVLICLQILSFIGGSNSISLGFDLFTLFYLIGYLLPGVCGIVSLFCGYIAYCNGDTAKIILHTNTATHHTIIKRICISLLFVLLLYIVFINLIRDGFGVSLSLIFSLFAIVLMLLYLMLHQGKKPSFLFSAAVVLAGMSYVCGILSNMTVAAIPYFAIGILYILIGVMLYKEKFLLNRIRVMGAIAFGLEMVMVIYYRLMYWAFIPFIIALILPTTIFAYTCIVPVCNAEE